ncbi:uncharacterized protein [Epargyreus clarus]|uniref:uncharacterized protein n=1 Tax=Epargyreus clarus TaxID=520877 RepID=UPI003C2F9C3F
MSVSYDLDTSGGLMPYIRALLKPPDEDTSTSKPKRSQHPYYKRPGKGHNRDCCDACGEGGALICCDRCPASFHLGCYDPPLDENDIPFGLWLCKECRASDAEKPTSSRSSRAQSPVDKSDADKKRTLRKKTKDDAKEKEKEELKDKKEGEDDSKKQQEAEPKEVNPIEVAVKTAKAMNPKQFELPKEMQIPIIFPGTEKEGSAKLVTSDPTRSCHVCAGGCKPAPLLQCDYCPLLFHQDCLDPPLTALPTGRFMCPNHVEQYIDSNLVKSVSATERVALWDKFTGPVDQHAIKMDFIRRARGNRPFRVKVPVGARGRVAVPEMVRQHYRRPPPLQPSRREFLRCSKVLRKLKAAGVYDESDEEANVTEETKHKICMNMSCPQYNGEGTCPMEANDEQGPSRERTGGGVTVEEPGNDAATVNVNAERVDQPVETSSHQPSTDQPESQSEGKKRKLDEEPLKPKVRLRDTKAINNILATAEEQLKDLDANTIKILAYQMMQQIAVGSASSCRVSGAGTWASRALAAVGARERAALRRLGVRVAPPPSALLPAAERRRIARLVWGAEPAPAAAPAPRDRLADRLVRAALCPLLLPPSGASAGAARLGTPVAVRNSLRVGTRGCDLTLDPSCRRVSDTHALIFCDQVTQHYELINYSEWGTGVNGTLYACDVSPRAHEPAERAARVPSVNREVSGTCRCPRGARDTAGAWEGGALLPHAALLQFGCQLYVFCLLDTPQD